MYICADHTCIPYFNDQHVVCRVRSDLLINVAGWEIVGNDTPQKHVVYSINIVVMGENFTKTARWSLIRQFHLACFDLNEHIGVS